MWKIFKALSYIFGFLPTPLFRFFWRATDFFDGRVGAAIRYILISARLASSGTHVYWGPFVYIDVPSKVQIGNNVSFHHGVTLLAEGGIRIGNNVSIAHASSLISFNHVWGNPNIPIKYNKVVRQPIEIRDDVWIGCGARILAGIVIEDRSVVAAGAVVNSDVESHSVYGGVPAKKIKSI